MTPGETLGHGHGTGPYTVTTFASAVLIKQSNTSATRTSFKPEFKFSGLGCGDPGFKPELTLGTLHSSGVGINKTKQHSFASEETQALPVTVQLDERARARRESLRLRERDSESERDTDSDLWRERDLLGNNVLNGGVQSAAR